VKFTGTVIVITLSMAALLFTGCATNRISHTNQLSVTFEPVSSKDAYISKVYAYEDGGELVVSGKVKRSINNCCDSTRGHIDIVVLGVEGDVLDVTSTMYSPRNIPKARSRTSHFTARLSNNLPEGATIRLAYHSDKEVFSSTIHADGTLVCERNMALPPARADITKNESAKRLEFLSAVPNASRIPSSNTHNNSAFD
jgi:hypothetical protein